MTLVIQSGWNGLTDPDAVSYVAAVEAADGEELEYGVAKAINDFVLGCKTDEIWDAIKACCILAGARTLNGALVPLVGTAPTNYNFVSGDYNRETGLVGDGSTKYLDSNRNNNSDPQDSQHLSVFATADPTYTTTRMAIGAGGSGQSGASHINSIGVSGQMGMRSRSSTAQLISATYAGLLSISRASSGGYSYRHNSVPGFIAQVSSTPFNANIQIFAAEASRFSDARLAFYSIGESLDLALLDTRVSNLITAIGGAI